MNFMTLKVTLLNYCKLTNCIWYLDFHLLVGLKFCPWLGELKTILRNTGRLYFFCRRLYFRLGYNFCIWRFAGINCWLDGHKFWLLNFQTTMNDIKILKTFYFHILVTRVIILSFKRGLVTYLFNTSFTFRNEVWHWLAALLYFQGIMYYSFLQ